MSLLNVRFKSNLAKLREHGRWLPKKSVLKMALRPVLCYMFFAAKCCSDGNSFTTSHLFHGCDDHRPARILTGK